jgi:hypothetical protein
MTISSSACARVDNRNQLTVVQHSRDRRCRFRVKLGQHRASHHRLMWLRERTSRSAPSDFSTAKLAVPSQCDIRSHFTLAEVIPWLVVQNLEKFGVAHRRDPVRHAYADQFPEDAAAASTVAPAPARARPKARPEHLPPSGPATPLGAPVFGLLEGRRTSRKIKDRGFTDRYGSCARVMGLRCENFREGCPDGTT